MPNIIKYALYTLTILTNINGNIQKIINAIVVTEFDTNGDEILCLTTLNIR